MSERQIILDTETTGLEVSQDHRIIEIGCVEMRNRRPTGQNWHQYLNPERAIDAGAQEVHGIGIEQLLDKPCFRDIARQLWDYLEGAQLVIHNAAFDIGFLNAEFARAGFKQRIDEVCTVLDTVALARQLHPGQKVNLDALCRRYSIDNSHRELHGALMDARLLADVYLAMTGGQVTMSLAAEALGAAAAATESGETLPGEDAPLRVLRASEAELAAHVARLKTVQKKSGGKLLWTSELPQDAAPA